MIYRVEKTIDGFSTCFRQWNATHSHCRFLHGYAISFRLYFKAHDLNKHNWVWDFGWLKNAEFRIDNMTTAAWFSYMFDHTVIVAENDPELNTFKELDDKGLIQLRTIPVFSSECIAEFVLKKVGSLISDKTDSRAILYRVDAIENSKNIGSAEIT